MLGIDLGTTNSTTAEIRWDPARPESPRARCLEVDQETLEGKYTHVLVPSVVALHGGRTVVGEGAKRIRARMEPLGLARERDIFWECKNDIGVRKTYGRAPEGFRSAADIAGHVLRFLHEAALAQDDRPVERVVVTVPASFQAAQRADTVRAAQLAGLSLQGGDLLDEPLAAFLDYLVTNGAAAFSDAARGRNLLVFDFGGGTCDVAIFTIEPSESGSPIRVSPRTVSRYHRLGGGDIDAAIVYEVLLPQLLQQNGLTPLELGYREKKHVLEPALLGLAEALKIGLCIQIRRLQRFGKYDGADKAAVVKVQPGTQTIRVGELPLRLQAPRITAAQFETLLTPFFDQDLLYARETEYRLTGSIFAPIEDALNRAGIDRGGVHYALLVGGSSLIPQLEAAVSRYLPNASILSYTEPDAVQTAVARGAAYHALALSRFGRGLVEPICCDSMSIRTASGLSTLVPAGSALPYPRAGFHHDRSLALPRTNVLGETLRVEVVSGSGPQERVVIRELWHIPASVSEGQPLELTCRLDENQVLDLALRLADSPDTPLFARQAENPISNVVNPQVERQRIAEREEDVRTGQVPAERIADVMKELGESYGEIGQKEKAVDYLKEALRRRGRPDAELLNRIAALYGDLRDWDRAEKFYREAASAGNWSGPLFNLALSQRSRGMHSSALETIDEAIGRQRLAPYVVLRGLIAESLGQATERERSLREGFSSFRSPLYTLGDWELGWYLTAAVALGNDAGAAQAREEQKKRCGSERDGGPAEGLLPIVSPAIERSQP